MKTLCRSLRRLLSDLAHYLRGELADIKENILDTLQWNDGGE